MCIYLTNEIGLTYTSGEHVLPAGIGGKAKLPKGYVSDQFNNRISALEKEFMRESLLLIPRSLEGPGKRGSLKATKATKSGVVVIKDINNETKFSLGYMELGSLYHITQFSLNLKTNRLSAGTNPKGILNHKEHLISFIEDCKDGNFSKTKIIIDDQLPEGLILFGASNEVDKNFDSYFAKNESTAFRFSIDKIQKIASYANYDGELNATSYQPSTIMSLQFSIEHFRLYGKMALNCLAHIKGKDFVMMTCFDPVRNWIANGGENNFASFSSGNTSLKSINIPFPKSAHVILITKCQSNLMASIFLYGSLSAVVSLSRQFEDNFDLEGLVCDWGNEREFKLHDYLGTL